MSLWNTINNCFSGGIPEIKSRSRSVESLMYELIEQTEAEGLTDLSVKLIKINKEYKTCD